MELTQSDEKRWNNVAVGDFTSTKQLPADHEFKSSLSGFAAR